MFPSGEKYLVLVFSIFFPLNLVTFSWLINLNYARYLTPYNHIIFKSLLHVFCGTQPYIGFKAEREGGCGIVVFSNQNSEKLQKDR